MTETSRYLSAAALYVAGMLVLAALLVQLPSGSAATASLTAGVGWFVLYPGARLTWLRSFAEWRYWASGALVVVVAPILEAMRREAFGTGPIPALQWLTAGMMIVVFASLAVRAFRRQ